MKDFNEDPRKNKYYNNRVASLTLVRVSVDGMIRLDTFKVFRIHSYSVLCENILIFLIRFY